MKMYVKIDRATGNVLKLKRFDDIERALNKPHVWIELEVIPNPTYDEDNEKLVELITQPDLSDLNVDVPPTAKRVVSVKKTPLTNPEKQARKLSRIRDSDRLLARIVEDILVVVATKGSAMERSDFSAQVWTKINNRRALRGEAAV